MKRLPLCLNHLCVTAKVIFFKVFCETQSIESVGQVGIQRTLNIREETARKDCGDNAGTGCVESSEMILVAARINSYQLNHVGKFRKSRMRVEGVPFVWVPSNIHQQEVKIEVTSCNDPL